MLIETLCSNIPDHQWRTLFIKCHQSIFLLYYASTVDGLVSPYMDPISNISSRMFDVALPKVVH